MAKTLFVIDGHSYIYQSFFGMPPLTNAEGHQVQAAFGITGLLWRIREELRPEYWAFTLDTGAPTFRHEAYQEYKAHRQAMPDELKAQFPWIEDVLRGFRIPVLRQVGFEADDVVATLTRLAVDRGLEVRIVSRDKDLQQMLSDHVAFWDPKDGSTFGPAELEAKRGLTPGRVVEYLSLVGDTSDNVPGVAGVGPKTALKVLEAVDDLEQIFQDPPPEGIPGAALKKIRDQREAAELSRELVRLRTDVPLDQEVGDFAAFRIQDVEEETLRTAWRQLGFSKFLKLLGDSEPARRSSAPEQGDLFAEPVLQAPPPGDYVRLTSIPQLEELVARTRRAKRLALVTETSGEVRPHGASPTRIGLAVEKGQGYEISLEGPDALEPGSVWEVLGPVLGDEAVSKIGEDLKATTHALANAGLSFMGSRDDTSIAAYLLNSLRKSYSLGALTPELMDHELSPDGPLSAAESADYSLRMAEHLREQLESKGLVRVYDELEIPLIEVLVTMERHGITLDPIRLQELEDEVSSAAREREREIYELAGEPFDINSPKQLAEMLFVKLGLPSGKKTKTGFSTSADVLEELTAELPENPLPAKILEYRSLTKLLSTYIHALPPLVRRDTGRIHTLFSQTVAATGRLSSSDPNLQNIPIRTDLGRRIRRAFTPNHAGHRFLSADYSQIELRILAHVCGDSGLRSDLIEGADIHQRVAARIFGVPEGEVSRAQRSAAKAVNFGVIYGMGPFGLSKDLGISFAEAKSFIEAFFRQFPRVREFIDNTIAEARELGEVRTLFGRRRPTPDILARMPSRRQRAEREAVNTVVQGSAADLIKKAMIEIHGHLMKGDRSPALLLQIHDELLFEVPNEHLEEEGALIRGWMEGVLPLEVPLTVNISYGDDWYDASK